MGTNSTSEISTVPPTAEIAAVTGTNEQMAGFNDDEAKEHNDKAQDDDHSVNSSESSEYSDTQEIISLSMNWTGILKIWNGLTATMTMKVI